MVSRSSLAGAESGRAAAGPGDLQKHGSRPGEAAALTMRASTAARRAATTNRSGADRARNGARGARAVLNHSGPGCARRLFSMAPRDVPEEVSRMDVTADYLALRREGGAVEVRRDVVVASGPDTETFLQGQLSQDVTALVVGASAPSLLLSPQGKLVVWLRVSRLAPDVMALDTDAGWGDALVARLERFKLRTRCDLERRPDWRCVALRGPGVADLDLHAMGALAIADGGWGVVEGRDLLGPDVVVPDGIRRCGLDAYDNVRIECGVPIMGAELDEGTIPAEAGIVEPSVSWTKGCYTGQE